MLPDLSKASSMLTEGRFRRGGKSIDQPWENKQKEGTSREKDEETQPGAPSGGGASCMVTTPVWWRWPCEESWPSTPSSPCGWSSPCVATRPTGLCWPATCRWSSSPSTASSGGLGEKASGESVDVDAPFFVSEVLAKVCVVASLDSAVCER